MFNLGIGFFICDTTGFLRLMYIIRFGMGILRFVIPIILIIMIALDVFKNVINVDEKDGARKIIKRLVAAGIVFFVPTIVRLITSLIGYIEVVGKEDINYSSTRCYSNATMECIKKVEEYLNCEEYQDEEQKKECQKYRKCNGYILSNSCDIKTEVYENSCADVNKNNNYNR